MARKRPKARTSFGLIPLLIACGFIVIMTTLQRERQHDTALLRQIDASLQALNGQDLTLAAQDLRLDILSTPPAHRTARQIERMLRATGDKSGTYTFRDKRVGIYTMSAQGVDHRQHLVNTFLEGYAPFPVDNVALPLYAIAKRKRYQLDSEQYPGRPEVWQSSRQAFYYPSGDCEDHAILLADWLIAMGEDARVAIGTVDGEGHAWVILFRQGQEYLLEATQKRRLSRSKPYPLAALFTDYHPQFMFNRNDFWEVAGAKPVATYTGAAWKCNSRLSLTPPSQPL